MFRFNCRYFVGEKPCRYNRFCDECSSFSPIGKRILIIKLAAIGDVLRTTPLLTGLKKKYPESYITWLTDPTAAMLLKETEGINRLVSYNNAETFSRFFVEQFDILISLDKEVRATGLATLIQADEKIGFGLTSWGTLYPFNKQSEYAFMLGISDELKFRVNRKTYPEIIYEMVGLSYHREEYLFHLPKTIRQKAKSYTKKWGIKTTDLVIGLNTGCGSVFATKKWTIPGFLQLAERIHKQYQPKVKILLLGGPEEVERNAEIIHKSTVPLIDTGTDNSLLDFCGIIDLCDAIVTADSLAMHLAIALKKQVVAFFGPTCAQEIELYGRGERVVVDADCAPCYRKECSKPINCMEQLDAKTVFAALKTRLTHLSKQ